MESATFALLAMFGVPFGMLALLMLAFKIIPRPTWKSWPVQIVATLWFLALIAAPFAITIIDSQGEYYDGPEHLVGATFAVPQTAAVNYQRDRTNRYGDCWRNAVNWRSDVTFASPAEFDAWLGSENWRDAIVAEVAGYFGTQQGAISVGEGALDLRDRDARYVLRDDHNSYQWNTRIFEYSEPFVCTAIDRDESTGAVSLRACDPLASPDDMGSEGRIVINPSAKKRELEGKILYLDGPSYCVNPLRKAVNDALGLPHPKGGSNLSVGSIWPRLSPG